MDRRTYDPRLPEDWSPVVRRNSERAAALAEPVRRSTQARSQAPGTNYHQLLKQEPRTAGERIRADYRAWQALAEAQVRERRWDVVIEIAPGGADGFATSTEPTASRT
ncbi:hypothetical protein [Streptomyces sp. NPDC089795]|uniref:hypothetical protein n=1 Tax=Streptomyces sp. NPDC089795 TaxID=3155297 RepID=UPI003429E969